jgi:hypothetical protein
VLVHCGCQSEDHPENNLVKFGYIVDMIVGKSQNPFYILGYLMEVIIRLGRFGPFFSHEQ